MGPHTTITKHIHNISPQHSAELFLDETILVEYVLIFMQGDNLCERQKFVVLPVLKEHPAGLLLDETFLAEYVLIFMRGNILCEVTIYVKSQNLLFCL